ncbi:MAG: hypothetical protein CMP09_15910 [Yangia sp.]|nr:hypothetical protein [Salipiger sp.]|tara:strand:- start:3273 stop:3647 length:375 start_codon:yes stop_codon:yes gene_type:complete
MMAETSWRDVDTYRTRIPGDGSDERVPMIRVCTVSEAEVSDRTAHGEYDIDVADEHTSFVWFSCRDGFDLAWRIARKIAKGGVFPASFGLEPGYVTEITFLNFETKVSIVVQPSPHHLQPREAA